MKYDITRQPKAAADFVAAIKTIASKTENLENLESYLSNHFAARLEKYANTPDLMACELKMFASMEF